MEWASQEEVVVPKKRYSRAYLREIQQSNVLFQELRKRSWPKEDQWLTIYEHVLNDNNNLGKGIFSKMRMLLARPIS